jgi:WD40 repeat protein
MLAVLRGHDGVITSVCFSQDGRRIVTSSGDKTLRIWDAVDTGEVIVRRNVESDVISLCFRALSILRRLTFGDEIGR